MIPFEDEPGLTDSEESAESVLDSNWDFVVRTSPGRLKDLQGRFPNVAERVGRRVKGDCGEAVSSIFRPGVPDFLGFDEDGSYVFVEVKSGGDGLRSSQLKWLSDFEGVNAEIWFVEDGDIDDSLDLNEFGSFSLVDKMGDSSNFNVREGDDCYFVELPRSLGAAVGLDNDSSFDWRVKSKSELLLDVK